jgi:RNA polymerase-binding transcription factor
MSSSSLESPLAPADVERLRRILVRRRDALVGTRGAADLQARDAGDAESEDGDAAERVIEQDTGLRMSAFDTALLAEIDRALAKIEAGTFGVSEDSGAPIPIERLEAVPWARRTVEEEERRHT